VTLYGVTFPQGKPVAVEDAFLLKKLEGNSHFREHEPAAPETAEEQAEPTEVQSEPSQADSDEPKRGAYTFKHAGRGKYNALDAAGEVVASGLTKEAAEAKAAELNEQG
jgi:hypothetical protein